MKPPKITIEFWGNLTKNLFNRVVWQRHSNSFSGVISLGRIAAIRRRYIELTTRVGVCLAPLTGEIYLYPDRRQLHGKHKLLDLALDSGWFEVVEVGNSNSIATGCLVMFYEGLVIATLD